MVFEGTLSQSTFRYGNWLLLLLSPPSCGVMAKARGAAPTLFPRRPTVDLGLRGEKP